VLFASIHQSPLYPGTGPLGTAGAARARATRSTCRSARSGEPLWLALLERVVMPAARAFEPQLILVSAGFDAHADDPLANCRLSTEVVRRDVQERPLARAGTGGRARGGPGGRL
jgi:acetoin utilization deacetylase AcuC-like enzyme